MPGSIISPPEIWATTWWLLKNIVVCGAEPQQTTASVPKPEPFTVKVNAIPPPCALSGESSMIVGDAVSPPPAPMFWEPEPHPAPISASARRNQRLRRNINISNTSFATSDQPSNGRKTRCHGLVNFLQENTLVRAWECLSGLDSGLGKFCSCFVVAVTGFERARLQPRRWGSETSRPLGPEVANPAAAEAAFVRLAFSARLKAVPFQKQDPSTVKRLWRS